MSCNRTEPPHDKTNKTACALSENLDQPGHAPRFCYEAAHINFSQPHFCLTVQEHSQSQEYMAATKGLAKKVLPKHVPKLAGNATAYVTK